MSIKTSIVSISVVLIITLCLSIVLPKDSLNEISRIESGTEKDESDHHSRYTGGYSYIRIQLDWERMGWSNPDEIYNAGDDLYLRIMALYSNGSVCSELNSDVLVGHSSTGTGALEPEPWNRRTEKNITLQFVNGIARNPDELPIKFFKAENIQFIAIIEHDDYVSASQPIQVHHIELHGVVSEPSECTVTVGKSQKFNLTGFDIYGNQVDIVRETWSVDENISRDELGMITENGLFIACDDFPGGRREEFILVNATGPFISNVLHRIPIVIENVYDIWLEEDEIQPESVLLGQPLKLQANIHYHVPAQARAGNLLEIKIRFSLVTVDGDLIVELVEKNVKLTNLNNKPQGIWIFNITLPSESFTDFVNMDKENNIMKNVNYMKVEILDLYGSTAISDMDRNIENNQAITELYSVVSPSYCHCDCPSFSPAPSSILVGMSIGVVICAYIMSRKR